MKEIYGTYYQDSSTGTYIALIVYRDQGQRLGSYATQDQARKIIDKELKEIYCNL